MNKSGKILLVGFGPGSEEQMTLRARAAIEESDVVIGYSTYIKLVEHLLAGKEVVRKGMTEEIDRSIEAMEQAKQGKTVALISSGDIGVYGMAGPTYEVLLQSGWTPESEIEVEVIPGTTALNAAASLVGAPLTHDFCAISLSDLLTPWPQIARRLEAAARGNFVVALYNPKSGRRTEQIVEAQRILLQYRAPSTPVAIVKSAYRKRQNIQQVELAKMSQCDIGMLSTVIIGNSDSYWQEGLMITPRGYSNKYQNLTGETHAGEKAGHSLSLGLEGWQVALYEHLQANLQESLAEAATLFDVPMAALLGALANREDDSACLFKATQVASEQSRELLAHCKSWVPLRATLQQLNGVTAQVTLNTEKELNLDGEMLLLGNKNGQFQMELSSISSIWFVQHEQSIHFLDRHGNTLFQLSQLEAESTRYQQTLQQFSQ
ncbi:MAG: precorrin-3B C(17)-methyltransferase [Candidatus Polarisedimenticolaceae bacterium]|nr:precorrin-3B C(17)-methyltransferase [Candidatus Polarisedimenticolaceae bacterium]